MDILRFLTYTESVLSAPTLYLMKLHHSAVNILDTDDVSSNNSYIYGRNQFFAFYIQVKMLYIQLNN